jgi:hypothetical protein
MAHWSWEVGDSPCPVSQADPGGRGTSILDGVSVSRFTSTGADKYYHLIWALAIEAMDQKEIAPNVASAMLGPPLRPHAPLMFLVHLVVIQYPARRRCQTAAGGLKP